MKTKRILCVLSLLSLGLAIAIPTHRAMIGNHPLMLADGTDPAPPVPVPPFLATRADAASRSSASVILLADGTDPAPPPRPRSTDPGSAPASPASPSQPTPPVPFAAVI